MSLNSNTDSDVIFTSEPFLIGLSGNNKKVDIAHLHSNINTETFIF